MESHNKLCMNCFASLEASDGSVCPVCGWDNEKEQIPEALAYQTIVGTHYLVGRAKAMNGEGITYSAFDKTTKKLVELREFFPVSIAARSEEDHTVQPMAGNEAVFDRLLDTFLSVSRNVSRLKEISVVHTLLDVYEENFTAYAVYEYVPALTLRRHIERNGVMSWNEANNMFHPVLTALGLINSLGIPHLGVSPDTIKVSADGSLVITGFAIPQLRQAGGKIIEELCNGAAAAEQYSADALCGESTDVYGFTATLLFAITGALPLDAQKRLKDGRLLIGKEFLKDLPPFVITAIANALQVSMDTRTTSFERLKAEFSAAPKIVSQVSNPSAIRRIPSMEYDISLNRGLPPVIWLLGACLITLVALIILASAWMKKADMSLTDIWGVFRTESIAAEDTLAPKMLGDSLDEWQGKINRGEYDFTIKVKSLEFSDTIDEGHIISQSPNYDEPMSADRVVLVTVSRGKENRNLPEIKGMTYEDLKRVLETNGFVVKQAEAASDEVVAGAVIRYQDHSEGDSLPYGAEVTVVVSTGHEG